MNASDTITRMFGKKLGAADMRQSYIRLPPPRSPGTTRFPRRTVEGASFAELHMHTATPREVATACTAISLRQRHCGTNARITPVCWAIVARSVWKTDRSLISSIRSSLPTPERSSPSRMTSIRASTWHRYTISHQRSSISPNASLLPLQSLIGNALAALKNGRDFVDWFDHLTRLSESESEAAAGAISSV
jgi:hypothetical protein